MTQFLNALLLLAAMCRVTSSRDISKRSLSTNSTCLLEIDGTGVLQELLQGDSVFINIKLSFGDSSDDDMYKIFDNNTTVIDINHWVVIVGKTGELLSTFPFDFEYLSLGTLTPGVQHISLNVTLVTECFINADDEEKLNIIATSLLTFENNEDVEGDVCIERQLTRDNFSVTGVYGVPSCYYTILQGSTYFDCWQITEEDGSIELSNIVTHFWLDVFYGLSIIFTLYFNLFFVAFFCRTEPMVEDTKKYFSIRTDLPMGPKYWLFYRGNENAFVFVARWLILLTLVCFLQYIPYFIANISDSENFDRRWEAIFNNGLIQRSTFVGWNIYVNLVFFIFGVILMTTWFKYRNWFETKFIETIMRDHFILDDFKIAPDLKIPKDNYSGLHRFLFVMKARTKMAVSISHWKHGLKGFWKSLTFANYRGLRCLLAIVLVGPFLVFYTIATVLNSIPLFYCMLRFFQLWVLDDQMKLCSRVLMISASLGLLFVEIALLGKFVSIFAYVSGIICYFCIGLLVNSGSAGPYVAVALIVFGYVFSTITEYYHGYVILLNEVISVVDALIRDNKIQVTGVSLPSFPPSKNQIHESCFPLTAVVNFGPDGKATGGASPHGASGTSPPGASGTTPPGTSDTSPPGASGTTPPGTSDTSPPGASDTASTGGSGTPQPGGPATTPPASTPTDSSQMVVRVDTEGLTAIEKHLFDLVVQKYRPTGIQILASVMRLVTLSLVIWVGFSTLKLIEDFTELKDQVELFASVVIAGIVPLFGKLMRNEAEEASKQKIRENCIQRDIESYFNNGSFETMAI